MKKLILTLAAAMLGIAAMAQQNVRTSYFMDTYAYSYRFNPSFIPRNGHVGLGIGNIGVSAESNLTGVAVENLANEKEYISYIQDPTRLNASEYVDLFSLGFHKGKFFHSIDVGVRADAMARVPKAVFETMETDLENEHAEYHLRNVALNLGLGVEVAYGLAVKLDDRINVGGRIKFLGPLANVNGQFRSMDVFVNDNIIDAKTDGYIDFNVPTEALYAGSDGQLVINDEEYEGDMPLGPLLKPAGFGLAFDLGASMKVADGLTVSLAVKDLGFLKKGNALRVQPGNFIIDTDESESDEDDSYFDKTVDNMPLTLVEHGGVSAVAATLTAGVEYQIPGCKGLSTGFVGTARMAGMSSWAEGRAVINYVAPHVLEVAVSGAMSSFGPGAGLALSLDLGPINLFAGVDSFLPAFGMTESGLPKGRLNTNAALGLTIIWGRNKTR